MNLQIEKACPKIPKDAADQLYHHQISETPDNFKSQRIRKKYGIEYPSNSQPRLWTVTTKKVSKLYLLSILGILLFSINGQINISDTVCSWYQGGETWGWHCGAVGHLQCLQKQPKCFSPCLSHDKCRQRSRFQSCHCTNLGSEPDGTSLPDILCNLAFQVNK